MSHAHQEQFSVAWMRLWISGYHLGLLLAIVQWKAITWKNSNFYCNLVKLYSTQNRCGHVCVPYTTWLPVSLWRRLLSRDSLPIIAYVLPNWSIKWKVFGSKQVTFGGFSRYCTCFFYFKDYNTIMPCKKSRFKRLWRWAPQKFENGTFLENWSKKCMFHIHQVINKNDWIHSYFIYVISD